MFATAASHLGRLIKADAASGRCAGQNWSPSQEHEGIEDEEPRLQPRDVLIEGYAVDLEIEARAGRGDHLNVELARLMPAAVQMPSRRDERCGVRPRRDGAGRGQDASPRSGQARGAGGDSNSQIAVSAVARLRGAPRPAGCPITPCARQLKCVSNDSLRAAQYRLAATAAQLPERQPLGLLPLPLIPGRQPAHVALQPVCFQRPQFAPVDHRSRNAPGLGPPPLGLPTPSPFRPRA